MVATETAVPFSSTAITTSQQYRDRYRPTQPDMVDDQIGGTALAVSDGGAGASINIANGGAVVQAGRYDLTGGPLNIAVAANGGGSNRFDIVCLTYDASHSPPIYSRIVQGTAGAGLPSLTNSATGVWDFPIAHYQKTPGGAIVSLTDRRKFCTNDGRILAADDATGPWYPLAPRTGMQCKFWPSRDVWEWDGSVWKLVQRDNVWTALTINSGYQNTFGFTPGYMQISAHQVRLRGVVSKISGSFTFGVIPCQGAPAPAGGFNGYFPGGADSQAGGQTIRWRISATGQCIAEFNSTGYTPTFASLDGIIYDI